MSRIIGVEQSLTNIEDALKHKALKSSSFAMKRMRKNVMLVLLQVRIAMSWELVIQLWKVL